MSKGRLVGIVLIALFALLLIVQFQKGAIAKPYTAEGFWVWVAAFLTLAILSFLYKDNAAYKFAEHLFVGVSAAYWMTYGVWSTLVPNALAQIYPPLVTNLMPSLADQDRTVVGMLRIVPCILGVMLLMRLSPKGGWISRWAIAFIVGTTAGLYLIRYLRSDFLDQIRSTVLVPVIAMGEDGFSLGGTISNIVTLVGVVCGLIYFFFSKEHKGTFGGASKMGIWVLMVTFGASFGYTVMARISLLTGRVLFLIDNWLGLVRY